MVLETPSFGQFIALFEMMRPPADHEMVSIAEMRKCGNAIQSNARISAIVQWKWRAWRATKRRTSACFLLPPRGSHCKNACASEGTAFLLPIFTEVCAAKTPHIKEPWKTRIFTATYHRSALPDDGRPRCGTIPLWIMLWMPRVPLVRSKNL